ncbi:hypothetical protein BH09SUM1_BH09SUM1_06440 [soil metagenome]
MSKLRAPLLVLFACWSLAAFVVWCAWGWKLEWEAPVWERMAYCPIPAIFAAVFGFINFAIFAAIGFAACWRILRARRPAEAAAVCFLVGCSVYGLFLAWTGLVHFWSFIPALYFFFIFSRPTAPFCKAKQMLAARSGITRESWLFAVTALLVFLAALAPAVESDGLRYHLPLVTAWERASKFVPVAMSANSNLPTMQSLLAVDSTHGWMQLDPGRTYQLIHAMHFLAMALLCGAIARRIHFSYVQNRTKRSARNGNIAAALAVLAAASVPVIAVVGAWPFADVASCAYLIGAIAAADGGILRGSRLRTAIVSLLLGACVATKLSNAPLVAIAGVFYLVRVCSQQKHVVRDVVALIVPAALVLGPWLVKNYIYHGNPVYPLAYKYFGGPEWSAANDIFYKSKVLEKGMGRGFLALIASPFNVTAHWDLFEQHNPGPLPLALLPVCVAAAYAMVKNRRARIAALPLALIAGGWGTWFFSYQSVRFLIPEFALIAVVAVPFLLANAGRWFCWVRGGLVFLCVAGMVWVGYYRLVTVPVYQAALGRIDQDLFITARFNAYPAVRWLEENTKQDELVFYIGEHRAGYAFHYQPVLSDWYDTPRVLSEIAATKDNDELLARWRKMPIRYVLLNLKELSGYEAAYFRPRFTDEQWDRYVKLRDYLLRHVAYDSGDGVTIARIDEEAGDGEKTLPKP